ncbi:MAG: hypothetical protein K2X74_00925 [Acetobacteraceae bacterium]|nr:hypothetical protein [Acetobacteraceae bacterium]
MAHITIDVPDDLAARLTATADRLGASPGDVILRVVRSSLIGADALDAWIAEGEADADAGRVVPFEDAMARVDGIIAEARGTRQG